jgi:hypothetical protein
MDVNRTINDFIDNLEPLEPNPPRSEVLYNKSLSESEKDWIVYYKSEED